MHKFKQNGITTFLMMWTIFIGLTIAFQTVFYTGDLFYGLGSKINQQVKLPSNVETIHCYYPFNKTPCELNIFDASGELKQYSVIPQSNDATVSSDIKLKQFKIRRINNEFVVRADVGHKPVNDDVLASKIAEVLRSLVNSNPDRFKAFP